MSVSVRVPESAPESVEPSLEPELLSELLSELELPLPRVSFDGADGNSSVL